MKNFVQPGISLTVVMPYARNSGDGVQVGAVLFGVSQNTYASGATGQITAEGVFTGLAKATGAGDNWAVGDRLFWDNTNKVLTKVSTGNIAVAIALEAAGTGVAVSGAVNIDPSTPAGT